VHVLEEGLAGERFYRWIGHTSGRVLDPASFWLVNGVLWALMVIVSVGVRKRVDLGWIIATVLGTVVVVNGVGHAVGTVMVRSYSPGLVSGVLLWVPLGSWTLWHSRRAIPGLRWKLGVVAGLMVQVGVGCLAWVLSLPVR
jgi:hypothetical protein